MLSRLKGIETNPTPTAAFVHSAIPPLDMLSRLKGIETFDVKEPQL